MYCCTDGYLFMLRYYYMNYYLSWIRFYVNIFVIYDISFDRTVFVSCKLVIKNANVKLETYAHYFS